MGLFEKLKELGSDVNVEKQKGEDGTVKGIRIDITLGISDENRDEDEIETRIEKLKEELDHLESLMVDIESAEPFELESLAHKRWQARMDLIESQIEAVEDEISELEEE